MASHKIAKTVLLAPEISEAVDAIKHELHLSFPAYLASDSRVVKYFADKGQDVPGQKRPGRPRVNRTLDPSTPC